MGDCKPWDWLEPYYEFTKIAEECIKGKLDSNGRYSSNVRAQIQRKVDKLYGKHVGDPAWDRAYRRWNEWDGKADDHIKEEVNNE